MKVDFSKLKIVQRDPKAKFIIGKECAEALSEFTGSVANLIQESHDVKADELAMLTQSLQNWLNRRSTKGNYCRVRDIFLADLGIAYKPEIAYPHPVVILEVCSGLALVVPSSTNEDTIRQAYHPIDNDKGDKRYRKVEKSLGGFKEDSVLILSNIRTISTSRLLGKKVGEIDNCLLKDIKETTFELYYPKQHIELLKLRDSQEEWDKERMGLEKKIGELESEKKQYEKQLEYLKEKLTVETSSSSA